MNTKLFKYIIAFVLTFLALPMMAQDYMTIYFKDGTNRMFYLEDVSEITTSKFDADGAFHNDYDFQYVITQQKKYVYALNDVDSITFTKFDEEIVEKNLSSVMTTLSPILGKSNSIDDIKENINSIKESEGVEDAWCSNNDLFVKVEGWETMAFHMNHEREFDLNDVNKTRIVENIKETFARINTLVKSDGSKIKIVIANQQHNDESDIRFFYREKLFIPIVSELNENNISATYVDNPDLDFFSSDIYDYDVVFLITHGGYNQQSGIHSFITSDELGTATFESEQDPPSLFRQQLWRDRLWWYRRKDQFKGATNQHFYLKWVKEIREGKELWVAYPCVTEQFFIDYSRGVFPSSNSVLFNGACQTLMGNDGNASFNMAEVFRRHNLGVYVGYTHSNCLGQVCGTTFLSHLLKGNSIVKSFNDLKNATFNYTTKIGDSNLEMPSLKGNYHQEENIDYNEDGSIKTYFTAELKMYPEKTEVANALFLFPTVTVEKSQDNINKDYSQGGVVVLEGITSFYDISKDNLIREEMNITDNTHHEIKYGFEYGTNEYIQNWKIDANISSMSYDSESGNCLFKATLKNLEPGKYYYRAYTYDGLVYNYGKRCSFEISHIVNLAVGDVFTVDDVVYKVTSISPLEVQIGSGMHIPAIDQSTSGAFEVPSTVKGTDGNIYSVTSIGENAFMWCKGLISIYIGNNVKSIGDYAFCYCDGLKSIIIPNSVTSIGEGAFYGSKGITSVTIPNSVTFIGDKTFFECDNLKSIVIPNSVTYIGEETFRGCESLTTVTIGNKVTSIGKCAFQKCTGLTTVGLGNSVTSIGDFAFYGCNSLTSVNIPSSVTTIGFFAFLNCGSLTSIKIPKSVTSIGDGAFRYCSSLAKIYADATTPLEVDYWLFEGVDVDNCVLYVPKGCVNKYRWATGWEVFKNIVEME